VPDNLWSTTRTAPSGWPITVAMAIWSGPRLGERTVSKAPQACRPPQTGFNQGLHPAAAPFWRIRFPPPGAHHRLAELFTVARSTVYRAGGDHDATG
jgi:hypothetical protein